MLTSISIAILATLGYHLAQKYISAEASPGAVLFVTYSVALAISVVVFYFLPTEQSFGTELRTAGWQSVGLGLAVVGIEVGFLLAYRADWNLSTAGLIANAAVALLLLPIGYLFLKERLMPINMIGIAVCLVGLILINIQAAE